MRTGEPAFNHLFGTSYFDYLEHTSAAGAIFNDAMTAQSTQLAAALVAAYDFAGIDSVIDVALRRHREPREMPRP